MENIIFPSMKYKYRQEPTGNTVFFVCLKYDVISPFLFEKNNISVAV